MRVLIDTFFFQHKIISKSILRMSRFLETRLHITSQYTTDHTTIAIEREKNYILSSL